MKTIPRATSLLVGPAALAAVVGAQSPARPSPSDIDRADSGRAALTAADVRFMQGMIHHHTQAVTMAQWAPTRDASPAVRTLAERIDVAQRDEMDFMKRWLRERHLPVPNPMAGDMKNMPGMSDMHDMSGMDTTVMMPGMLTPEQMKELDAAHGPEFDRLFLAFMIQHHQGALKMV